MSTAKRRQYIARNFTFIYRIRFVKKEERFVITASLDADTHINTDATTLDQVPARLEAAFATAFSVYTAAGQRLPEPASRPLKRGERFYTLSPEYFLRMFFYEQTLVFGAKEVFKAMQVPLALGQAMIDPLKSLHRYPQIATAMMLDVARCYGMDLALIHR